MKYNYFKNADLPHYDVTGISTRSMNSDKYIIDKVLSLQSKVASNKMRRTSKFCIYRCILMILVGKIL